MRRVPPRRSVDAAIDEELRWLMVLLVLAA